MSLLIQIYAPLQSEKVSPLLPPHPRNRYRDEFDRLLYVFGCTKKGCLGVRCLRAARRSEKYAQEGREKRKKAKLEAEDAKEKASVNPFSSSSINPSSTDAQPAPNPFASGSVVDFGTMIFGDSLPAVPTNPVDAEPAKPQKVQESNNVVVAESNLWPASTSSVCVPPRYLATDSERLSTAPTSRQAKMAKQVAAMSLNALGDDKELHKGGRVCKTKAGAGSATTGGSDGWSAEAYEIMRVAGVEEVFLAFQERLEASDAAEQVVRYDFGGTPLPYSGKSKPYNLLWTSGPAPGQSSAITRAAYAPQQQQPSFKRYDTTCRNIPRCPHCNSSRTFEMQLMPNLVTIVEKSLQDRQTKGEEKEVGWATLWVFVCSADCLEARQGQEDLDDDGKPLDWLGWREEVALVELED